MGYNKYILGGAHSKRGGALNKKGGAHKNVSLAAHNLGNRLGKPIEDDSFQISAMCHY
jgi:hypothetical protein